AFGHFGRFSHDKIFIEKRNGTPTSVLTGSANWSIRGLYVQANSVLLFDDPSTARLYEASFETSVAALPKGKPGPNSDTTKARKTFAGSYIAKQWFPVVTSKLPAFSVAFSPHTVDTVSLAQVAERVKNAKSSVLFAIMQLAGGGPVMDEIRTLVE